MNQMPGLENNTKTRRITLYTIIALTVFALIYSQYMSGLNTSTLSSVLRFYISFTFWLHFLILVSLAFVLVYTVERILISNKVLLQALLAVIGSLLAIYLYVDSKIYSVMSLHLNRFVIETLVQEDALAEIGISPGLMILSGLPVLLFVVIQLLISPLSRITIATVTYRRQHVVVFFLVLFALLIVDKLLYSYFYYKAQPFVFQLREAPPAYLVPHSYHINKFFSQVLGNEPKVNFTEPLVDFVPVTGVDHLDYPVDLGASEVVPDHNYNIVMIVVESLRQHDVDSKTSPFMTQMANEAIQAKNHYTGGNTTHFGLFSLFYGLNPYYFHDFRISQVPPAGISLLERGGYSIYSTTARTMRWYDMDKFMLGRNARTFVPEGGKNYERDRLVTDRSIEIARTHVRTGIPYLNFIYYYTTHADYEHPEEHTIFEPELKGRVDYSNRELKGVDRHKLVNRYRNAIHSVDSEVERLVRGIQQTGDWENTILVITSDHGEEFFEEDSFGHNTNLNEYQIRVPLMIRIPGRGYIEIVKNTSHMDVMQTLLGEIFGRAKGDMPFQGRNILSDDSGMVYVARAHYQRPSGYAILDEDFMAIANLNGGFLEIESVSAGGEAAGMDNWNIRRGVIGLLKQIRELRK